LPLYIERHDGIGCSQRRYRKEPRAGTGETVATILDLAGATATENPAMTQDVYMNTLKRSTKAAEVMGTQLNGLI
jgi:hypothetical protein